MFFPQHATKLKHNLFQEISLTTQPSSFSITALYFQLFVCLLICLGPLPGNAMFVKGKEQFGLILHIVGL